MNVDVAIVGAGPAGVACARELESAGVTSFALLDDSPVEPGTFLPAMIPPKTTDAIGAIRDDLVVGTCYNYAVGCREKLARIPAAVKQLPHIGLFVNKPAYYTWLREPFSDRVVRARATGFEVLGDGVVLHATGKDGEFDVKANLLVVASGFGNVNDRPPFAAGDLEVPKTINTVWVRFSPLTGTQIDEAGELGIVWNSKISKRAYLNWYNIPGVGFYVAILDAASREHLADLVERVVERHPVVSQLVANSERLDVLGKPRVFIELPRTMPKRTFGPRVLVAGARAGFNNTFVYEGVWQSFLSGSCAGKVAAGAVRAGKYDAATLSAYEAKWKEAVDAPNLKPGRASASVFYESGKLDQVARALVTGLLRENSKPPRERQLQHLFLDTMLSAEYSRKNDLTWARALLANVSLLQKATLAPVLLRAAFKG
ncbi:MAG: hypothetical protein Kow0069_33100 [Promethearchaeota archaeon]